MTKARVVEIFSSLQGEGLYAGQKQIFVRLAGCDVGCDYCDQPEAWNPQAGTEMAAPAVAGEISRLAALNGEKDVSLTGGEPLLHVFFLLELCGELKKRGFRIHLETNGIFYGPLKQVIDCVDVVAADVKLPSSTGKEYWENHRRFLGLSLGKVFVKIVLTSDSGWDECVEAVRTVEEVSHAIPVFLQPATPVEKAAVPGKRVAPAGDEFVGRLAAYASGRLKTVKILPQQHPLWGIK